MSLVVCVCGRHGDYIYPGVWCLCGRIVLNEAEQAKLYAGEREDSWWAKPQSRRAAQREESASSPPSSP